MSPIRYSTMTKSKDKGFLFGIRLQMIRDAMESGIKPASRLYGVSKNTVKKWLKKHQQGGTGAIKDLKQKDRTTFPIKHLLQ